MTSNQNFKTFLLLLSILFVPSLIWTAQAQDDQQQQSNLSALQPGHDMKSYVFQDTLENDVSLAQFQGKYILLDVWASWCHPCINEFPKVDSLKQAYKGRNLEVVQISCDHKKQAWLNGRFWYKRTGNQFWINGKGEFMQDLQVASIPRYMLIDKEGLVLDANLPRPGTIEMDAILNKLEGL